MNRYGQPKWALWFAIIAITVVIIILSWPVLDVIFENAAEQEEDLSYLPKVMTQLLDGDNLLVLITADEEYAVELDRTHHIGPRPAFNEELGLVAYERDNALALLDIETKEQKMLQAGPDVSPSAADWRIFWAHDTLFAYSPYAERTYEFKGAQLDVPPAG